MQKTIILVIGRHAQIMETVLRLLNSQEGWEAVGALTDEDALEKFTAHDFDIVLMGGGIEESSEEKLRVSFAKHRPQVRIVRHYGGGSGLLFNEIIETLEAKPST
jgi:DNA-binding NarL/FixJ family response regulator